MGEAVVELRVRDRAALHHAFVQNGSLSGVFVRRHLHLVLGQEVELQVVVVEGRMTFSARGVVRWKRHTTRGDVHAGIGVGFAPGEDEKREQLLDFALARDNRVKRRSPRYPVAVEVEYAAGDAFFQDTTDDLSLHGAFISTNGPRPVGESFELCLKPPGHTREIHISAAVRWRQRGGRAGLGVEFVYEDAYTRRRMVQLIQDVESKILDGIEHLPS